MATERAEGATWGGRGMVVLGDELKAGDTAPAFRLPDRDWKPVALEDLAGRTVILSCVPSLYTAVCPVETVRWEKETRSEPGSLAMVTVSMDLPMAIKAWCGANDVNHTTLSAHRNEQFGVDYGVLIRDVRLLMRAVFVIGADGRILHTEYVTQTGTEPDYEAILRVVRGQTVSA